MSTVRGVTVPSTFRLRDVVAGPTGEAILRGLTVDVPCDGITAVAGPSGAGKSSMLRLLNRLDDATSGTIEWEGKRIRDWDPTALRRRVAMVFQRPPVFSGSVFDNLCVAVDDLDRAAAASVLERVGLPVELLDRKAADLSGGEAQRMCFARALLTDPAVLLADEPTTSLDGAARATIEDLGRRIADSGVAIVWVTHDVPQLRRLADHVMVLVAGRVLAFGHLAELDRHPDPAIRELVGAP